MLLKKLCHILTYSSFILLSFIPSYTFAQNEQIDSIKSILKHSPNDTSKVINLNYLGDLYRKNSDYEKVFSYSQKAIDLAKKIQYRRGIANAYNNFGNTYYSKGDFPQALKYYLIALKIDKELKDDNGIAARVGNIGNIYAIQGDNNKALSYYIQALKLAKKLNNKKFIVAWQVNIGSIYRKINNLEKALSYYSSALNEALKQNDIPPISACYGNIGNIYYLKAKKDSSNKNQLFRKSLIYYKKAIHLKEMLNDQNGIIINLINIGLTFEDQLNLLKALEYYYKALELAQKIEDKNSIAICKGNIGSAFLTENKYILAEKNLSEALSLFDEIGDLASIMEVHQKLSLLYEKMGKNQSAYTHYKLYTSAKDSLFNLEKEKDITRKELTYEFEIKEQASKLTYHKKIAVANAEKERQKIITFFAVTGLILATFFIFFIFLSLRKTARQKKIIEIQKEEVELAKTIIEEKNNNITDSLNYAKRIQRARLPHRRDIWNAFPQSFVIYKPKDIVSGDFYFFHKMDDRTIIAAADCTGHGVPGAFMSMLSSDLLNDAVSKTAHLPDILTIVNQGIKTSLKQSEDDDSTRDGMDIAICSFLSFENRIEFSGANRPLWIIRKNGTEIEEIKSTKKAIGGTTDDEQIFENHSIQTTSGDTLYLFTDGYADAFNGETGKKLTTKKFKELLLQIQHLEMKEQEHYLDNFITQWIGKGEQIDDILIIGIRV